MEWEYDTFFIFSKLEKKILFRFCCHYHQQVYCSTHLFLWETNTFTLNRFLSVLFNSILPFYIPSRNGSEFRCGMTSRNNYERSRKIQVFRNKEQKNIALTTKNVLTYDIWKHYGGWMWFFFLLNSTQKDWEERAGIIMEMWLR